MRFGPVLVPGAIVVAIGVIVAAEAGWLDGSNPDPVVIRSEAGIHGSAPNDTKPSSTADKSEPPTSTGRSVGKEAAAKSVANGAGGAGLDDDQLPPAAPPASAALEPTPTDGLQQARDEAAKAKQDVLEVTRASLESQKASEAEFEREKSELNDKIARLQAKLDAAGGSVGATDPKQRADAVAQADAKAATAAAELADAHQRENALRTQLAELEAADGAGAKSSVDVEAKAVAEQALHQAEARAEDLDGKVEALRKELAASTASAAKANSATTALKEAQQHALDVDREVVTLRTRLASGEAVEAKLAAVETQRAAGEARAKSLDEKIAALTTEVAARDSSLRQVSAQADAAKPLAAELTSARQHAAALETQIADLRKDVTSDVDARTASSRTIAALKKQLEDSRLREQALGTKMAADRAAVADDKRAETATGREEARRRETDLSATIATPRDKLAHATETASAPAPAAADGPDLAKVDLAKADLAKLQDDLAGARRGEATLRRENGVLQRELADARAYARSLHDENEQAARAPATQGSRRALQKRADAAPDRSRQVRSAQSDPRPPAGADDQRAVILRAKALIRVGRVDQARQLLQSARSPATTRALADTYNPLTNTQYGAIGVDSDADRASFLYQQAARPY